MTSVPTVSGFKPYGVNVVEIRKEPVFLLLEEYEALKLNDYENRLQCDAAQIMQISRPTLTRIYISARQKIATAFVEGRQIIVEGGKVEYTKGWFTCIDCSCIFDKMKEDDLICPLCRSLNLDEYLEDILLGNDAEAQDRECGRMKSRKRGNRRRNDI